MHLNLRRFLGIFLLFLATCVWGYAFVVQKEGMKSLGVYGLTAMRFLLGGLLLTPFFIYEIKHHRYSKEQWKDILFCMFILGFFLFVASNLQQAALAFITVGNSGFITSTYVIFVPLLSLIFWKKRVHISVWIGVGITFLGLCLLSVTPELVLQYGDILTLICAIFYALHVIYISEMVKRVSPFLLASGQFFVCAFLSMIATLLWQTETMSWSVLWASRDVLFYTGILSVGVGFTVQIVGQKYVAPSLAAIILSFEAITASFAGWLFLNEVLTLKTFIACGLVLLGCLTAQMSSFSKLKALSLRYKNL